MDEMSSKNFGSGTMQADINVENNQICDILKRWSQIKVGFILIIFLRYA